MGSEDDKQGAPPPPPEDQPSGETEPVTSGAEGEGAAGEETPAEETATAAPPAEETVAAEPPAEETAAAEPPAEETATAAPPVDESHEADEDDYDDPYADHSDAATEDAAEQESKDQDLTTTAQKGGEPPSPPPPTEPEEDEDDGERGMLRMSFMEHLDELRSRIIKALMGVGVAFFACLIFANDLWRVVSAPAIEALTRLGYASTKLTMIKPIETFTIVWVKLPILAAIFLASPWLLYQVWAFIAPGLYRKERRWAVPFVMCSAGLFIMGGLFAYFVAFRFGLEFLLGIGRDIDIAPMVSISEYFDLFVNVTLGIGLVFEMPILIFFLTLLRIVTPGFLVRNARYAVLIIVIIAAIITPTPDVVNLMLFSVPMCLLYFVGIFGGYLLNLHREGGRFPWVIVLGILFVFMAAAATAVYVAVTRYGYQVQQTWPFLTQ